MCLMCMSLHPWFFITLFLAIIFLFLFLFFYLSSLIGFFLIHSPTPSVMPSYFFMILKCNFSSWVGQYYYIQKKNKNNTIVSVSVVKPLPTSVCAAGKQKRWEKNDHRKITKNKEFRVRLFLSFYPFLCWIDDGDKVRWWLHTLYCPFILFYLIK